MGIYFVDEQHQENFERALERWPRARINEEYMPACYILSVPMIFEKVERILHTFEYPVSWIWQWEWKYFLSKLPEYQDNEDESEEIEIRYDLTGSMVQMGKFALNMWNGYEHFNMRDCITCLDGENYKVVKCALDMRMGKYRF